jgi:hypothetical protein
MTGNTEVKIFGWVTSGRFPVLFKSKSLVTPCRLLQVSSATVFSLSACGCPVFGCDSEGRRLGRLRFHSILTVGYSRRR